MSDRVWARGAGTRLFRALPKKRAALLPGTPSGPDGAWNAEQGSDGTVEPSALVREMKSSLTARLTKIYQKNADEILAFGLGRMPGFVTGASEVRGTSPVFCFHDVEPEHFEAQLLRLQNGGYHTIDAETLERSFTARGQAATRDVALTFDDGTSNFWSYVFSLLHRYLSRARCSRNPSSSASMSPSELYTWGDTRTLPSLLEMMIPSAARASTRACSSVDRIAVMGPRALGSRGVTIEAPSSSSPWSRWAVSALTCCSTRSTPTDARMPIPARPAYIFGTGGVPASNLRAVGEGE